MGRQVDFGHDELRKERPPWSLGLTCVGKPVGPVHQRTTPLRSHRFGFGLNAMQPSSPVFIVCWGSEH